MNHFKTASISMDDIIFENRNRAYGAYILRKEYSSKLLFSIFVAVTTFTGFLFLINRSPIPEVVGPITPWDTTYEINRWKEKPFVKPKEEIPSGGAKTANPFAFKPVVNMPLFPIDTVSKPEPVGPVTSGTGTSTITSPGPGSVTTPEFPIVPDGEGETVVADVMPEFIGGPAAMNKFLRKNLEYPYFPQGIEKAGKVIVSFVVSKEGEVRDVKVIRSAGAAFDEEAARVIKKMPKWKPGIDKGRPVNVRFYIPIEFIVAD